MARARVLFMIPDLRNPANKGGIQVFNNYVVRALEELEVDTKIIGVNDRPEDSIPGLITCNRGGRIRKIIMRAICIGNSCSIALTSFSAAI